MCDWDTYGVRYQEVADKYGIMPYELEDHYEKYGKKSNLNCNSDENIWSCDSYMNRYPYCYTNSRATHTQNCNNAYKHYMNYGRYMGLNPTNKDCYEFVNGEWILSKNIHDKNTCKNWDSCYPGGGNMDTTNRHCCKWASGPNEEGEPWDGNYIIRNPNKELCISGEKMSDCDMRDKNQQWSLVTSDNAFLLKKNNNCLTVGENGNMVERVCENTDNQKFYIKSDSPHTLIGLYNTNYCISDGTGYRPGQSRVKKSECNPNDTTQHFRFIQIYDRDKQNKPRETPTIPIPSYKLAYDTQDIILTNGI